MSAQQNRDAMLEAARHFGSPATRERYYALYDERIVMHGSQGVKPGIESVKQYYQGFFAAFPDAQLLVEDVFVEGEKLACRFAVEATHLGPFQGIPATGKRFTLPGITVMRFEAGKCVERWTQSDFLGMMRQLGLLPASR